MIQAQIPVNIHCNGVVHDATARDIDSGIEIRLTVSDALILRDNHSTFFLDMCHHKFIIHRKLTKTSTGDTGYISVILQVKY